jgi:DinB superfamily
MAERRVVRDDILEWQNRIDTCLRGLDSEILETEAAVGDWTPSVVVAHLADWLEMSLANSRAAIAGAGATDPKSADDNFNDTHAIAAASNSWEANSHRLHNQVELTGGFLSDIDDAQWELPAINPWGGEGTVGRIFAGMNAHHEEHCLELQQWRDARDQT